MKFEDDDLKDGKLWAALQKEIDRDLAEKESGETFQEELADIEDSIEFESKETKSEDRIPDETANLSNLRSVLEATERAKDEEAKQKMKQTKVEPVTQDIEIPEFTEEEEEIEETPAETPKKVSRVSQTTEKLEGLVDFDDDPAETKTESEPEEVMVDDDLIINDPFADEDDLLGEEKTETKGSEKEVLGDQVEAAMERLVSDTVGHIPMPEIDDEDDDYDDYEDDDEEYIPHGAKPQKKKGKGGAVIAVAAVAVIAVGGFFYGSKMFHYQNYFFNGTTINGVDCSDMTAKEAETKIKEQAANYTLNVKFKDNDTKSVSGKDIDYTYAGDGSVESVLKKQNSFLWFLGNGGKEKDSQVTMQYSQEKLDAVIDGFDEFQSADGENAPASAYITFQNNEFEIVDAVMGEGMDLTLAKQCIENALINADTEVDLEKAGVYDGTLVTADDETLNAQKDQLNELVRASITYSMPDGTTQVLDGNTMKDWLAVDADGNYSKDENQWNERVKEYVANLAAAIDTNGKDHTFPATGIEGGVAISQEGYGWKVDQEQEIAKIAEEVDAHAADTREPQYAQREFAASTENNGFGKTYVEVDASRQHIWLYKDGNLVVDGDCVTGLMEQSSYTKPGIYTTAAKESQKKLHGELQADGSYSWERDVDSWIPFNGEIGFYDASWRSSFGGNLYLTAGSTTGSVALPTAVAQALYDNVDDGTPVIIYYSEAYEVSE
ncbi:MAG: L,D-transpeptidase family protein, partial [Blautia sp.]